MMVDGYRAQYKRHLMKTGVLEIHQRYIDEMKAYIEAENIEWNEDKDGHELVSDFLNSPGYDHDTFDEWGVIWQTYKLQCGDMGKIMQAWINDQYHVFLKMKLNSELESE